MNLTKFAKEVHENAVNHGWWEQKRSFGEIIALCHSELSEALEEYRNNRGMLYCGNKSTSDCECDCESCDFRKPEGIAVEMIDCIIRILDWCGKEGVDVDALLQMKHEYNKTRPYQHGGKVILGGTKMSKEKSGIIGVYAGREVTAQDIADAFDELEAARQEKEKREKGCEYCKVPGKYLATIDYDGAETRLFFDVVGNSLRVFDEEMPGLCDSFSIKFCPMCGRKMVQI